jgi:hypothetical protein
VKDAGSAVTAAADKARGKVTSLFKKQKPPSDESETSE